MAKFFDDAGNEVEAMPMEEVQKLQESQAILTKERDELAAEKKRIEEGGANKDENFVKLRTKLESTETALGDVTKRLNDKETYERTALKSNLIAHYAGEDEESRKKLEEEYGFINLDESNPENIAKRMEKAARVSGLYKETDSKNPIFAGFAGQAPIIKPTNAPKDDADNVLNTDKGKSALSAMGIPEDYGQPKK